MEGLSQQQGGDDGVVVFMSSEGQDEWAGVGSGAWQMPPFPNTCTLC